jgi:antirestriction protein ArdC
MSYQAKLHENLHVLVSKMIEKMEEGTGTWVKSWSAPYGFPQNFVSKKEYRGFNFFYLSDVMVERGYTAPYFLTFKQVNEKGGKVKKGAKSISVYFYKIMNASTTVENEESGEFKILNKKIPLLKEYKVFNIEDTEGIEYELPEANYNNNERYNNAEAFIKNTQAQIKHGGNRAFFRPSGDFIQMPHLEQFIDSDNYYATLLHELTHWSGGPDRLARVMGKKHGDKEYAFEELVAELGSVFLCSLLGISIEKNQHPEYLQSWITSLRENPQILWKAASKAQEAFDFIVKTSEDNSQYTVWVGGTEVTDNYLTKIEAEEIAQGYINDGYDDVQIEAA